MSIDSTVFSLSDDLNSTRQPASAFVQTDVKMHPFLP
jgi:hypothetical protein